MKSDEPVLAMNGKRASPIGAYPTNSFLQCCLFVIVLAKLHTSLPWAT